LDCQACNECQIILIVISWAQWGWYVIYMHTLFQHIVFRMKMSSTTIGKQWQEGKMPYPFFSQIATSVYKLGGYSSRFAQLIITFVSAHS
jgi:hypothetical protein